MDNGSESQLRTILLVDEQDGLRIMTKWFFNNFGYTVETARNAEEALARFDPRVHDLIITDNPMPGMSGAEMAHIIKLRSPSTPVVMFTGSPPENHSCLDLVLRRPAHLMFLKERVDRILSSPLLPSQPSEDTMTHPH